MPKLPKIHNFRNCQKFINCQKFVNCQKFINLGDLGGSNELKLICVYFRSCYLIGYTHMGEVYYLLGGGV